MTIAQKEYEIFLSNLHSNNFDYTLCKHGNTVDVHCERYGSMKSFYLGNPSNNYCLQIIKRILQDIKDTYENLTTEELLFFDQYRCPNYERDFFDIHTKIDPHRSEDSIFASKNPFEIWGRAYECDMFRAYPTIGVQLGIIKEETFSYIENLKRKFPDKAKLFKTAANTAIGAAQTNYIFERYEVKRGKPLLTHYDVKKPCWYQVARAIAVETTECMRIATGEVFETSPGLIWVDAAIVTKKKEADKIASNLSKMDLPTTKDYNLQYSTIIRKKVGSRSEKISTGGIIVKDIATGKERPFNFIQNHDS